MHALSIALSDFESLQCKSTDSKKSISSSAWMSGLAINSFSLPLCTGVSVLEIYGERRFPQAELGSARPVRAGKGLTFLLLFLITSSVSHTSVHAVGVQDF